MVKEIILKVGTAESVKNVGDLRENIKAYKAALEELNIGTKEYQDTLDLLKINQNALKDAMYGTAASFDQITNAATGANIAFKENNELVTMEGVSYNALVHSLADLKQAWRATTDEAERAQLGERINNVNNQLKKMDASVGTYGRNVGNYIGAVDHLTNGLSGMGKGAAGLIAPIKGATTALKTMSATPVIAVLGILASLLDQVMKAMKGSEEQSQAITAAMAPLASVGDLVKRAFQGLGKVVVKVAEYFGKLTAAIFKNNDAAQTRIELTEKEAALARQQRETLIKNAEAERDIAELRAKATDKLNYTATQRIAFLKEAGEKEKAIAQRAYEDAKKAYEVQKAKNSLAESSTEDKQKEAQAYADMVKAETNYFNAVRTINAGITKATREETAAVVAEQKVRDEARKAEIEAYRGLLRQEIDLAEAGSQERLDKQKELLAKEYEAAVANAKEKITNAETLARTLAALEQKYNNDVIAAEKEKDDAIAEQEKKRKEEAEKALEEAKKAEEERLRIEQVGRENRLNALKEGSWEYLQTAIDIKREELDSLHRLEDESEEDFRARQLAAEKDYYAAKEALAAAYLSTLQDMAGGVGDIFGSLADIMDADEAYSEKHAKGIKALRIAQATIDMLSGVVAAVSNAYKSADPATASVLAAVNSAAIIAAGTANIAKIRATKVSTKSSGSASSATVPAEVSAPAVAPQVQQVRNLTGASEEERLNRMAGSQRVYILSSDLEADANARRVQTAETTF